ncbi:hypothetical protein FQZ97_1062850 [compost metagenome]
MDAPATQLRAPQLKNSSTWSSMPQLICSWPAYSWVRACMRSMDPVLSLIAWKFGRSFSASMNSKLIAVPVRAGKL